MGQLDEAIRAHLDLKRRHGASEEEVHAKEQEALGPVRREAGGSPPEQAQQPGEPAGEHELDPGPPLDEAAFNAASTGPVDEAAFHERPTGPAEEEAAALPPEAFHEPTDPFTEPALEAPMDLPDPSQPTERVDEPGPAQPRDGETPAQGFERVEDVPAPEQGLEPQPDDDEDVLEETPEFLQETPEHDKLWFEQKPPRDFDFDE